MQHVLKISDSVCYEMRGHGTVIVKINLEYLNPWINTNMSCYNHSVNGKWKIILNYWDEKETNSLKRDSSHWDLDYQADINLNPNVLLYPTVPW